MDGAEHENGQNEGEYEKAAGQDTAREKLRNADACIESIDDEHDGRRDDDAKRGADGDAARFELLAVACLRHRR